MYSLAENWPPFGHVSLEESTVTEQSGGDGGGRKKRKNVMSSEEKDLSEKRMKLEEDRNENEKSRGEVETSLGDDEHSIKPCEPSKQNFIHVRARRGEATDSHSLAERARREKISEKMRTLQDLVPGCNKVIGKALVLDEIINYVQSLQHQVEFLSLKLEAVSSTMNMSPTTEAFPSKDVNAQQYGADKLLYGAHAPRVYAQSSLAEWLHMQVGGSFDRAA